MDTATQRALADRNRRFYDANAQAFSDTRNHAWPGWRRVVEGLGATDGGGEPVEGDQLGGRDGRRAGAGPGESGSLAEGTGCGRGEPLGGRRGVGEGVRHGAIDRLSRGGELHGDRAHLTVRVLDAGCGNGRLACFLREQLAARTEYTGIDACRALLGAARARLGNDASLLERDLVDEPLARALPDEPFDLVCAFGVLHHIPGFTRRRELVETLASRVAHGGRLALAFWRFAERERFRRRLLDWSAAPEIDPSRLEAGDLLLAWGEGGAARYCHASDGAEIEALLERVPLVRVDDFEADGREGNLNRYIVCEQRSG